jgi:long-chain fatty acid transport protein
MVSGVLIAGNAAYAGNVDSFGIGSRATALGGAYSATADDPFAAYYNPAGLAQITGTSVVVGSHFLKPDLKVYDFKAVSTTNPATTYIGPADFSDTSDLLVVPHLGFAMPINDKLVVGLAAYVPWGLDIKWDESSPAAYSSSHSWFDRVAVTPTMAYKINDQWSVGAGLSLGRSEAGDEHYIYVNGLSPASGPAGPLGNFKIKTDTTDTFNWSYNLGVMYKPSKEVTLGLTYRSKTNTDFSGTTRVSGAVDLSGAGGPDLTPYNQTVNTDLSIDHPYQIQFGVRYQPVQAVSLEFDFVRTNWSSIGSYTAKFDTGLVLLGGATSRTYERDWKDTNQIRFGAEWKALDWLTLRAGYFYDPSPIPDNTFDLSWPDADKKTYSIGAGFNLNKSWTVDTVVQYTYAEKKRELGGESENLNDLTGATVSYASMSADGELWGGGITVSYRF